MFNCNTNQLWVCIYDGTKKTLELGRRSGRREEEEVVVAVERARRWLNWMDLLRWRAKGGMAV